MRGLNKPSLYQGQRQSEHMSKTTEARIRRSPISTMSYHYNASFSSRSLWMPIEPLETGGDRHGYHDARVARARSGGVLLALRRLHQDPPVPPRSLQEFLSLHKWDEEKVARRVRELVVERHADPRAVGVFDETSFAKKGSHTCGVQRQYCGESGKIDNCVVTVHLAYATDDFHCLVDSDVFLPGDAWAADPARREEVGVPETVVHRPKWRIALELLDRCLADGVAFPFMTADEGYGRCGEFRAGLTRRGLSYVVEVPRDTTGRIAGRWCGRRVGCGSRRPAKLNRYGSLSRAAS